MLVSQNQSGYSPGLRNPPFPVAQPTSNFHSPARNISSASVSGTALAQSSFRAPAHKHAHHLHSIPPREKSTRTLIIDHMLWVHGRTRFAQARAELGMTDRTGGPSSSNYAHRRRPENYEEEDEEGSEGEDLVNLKARAGDPDHTQGDDQEESRLHTQDLTLARSLRLRAEGLEKVVTSMLAQPPRIHTLNDEDIWTPPTSPKLNPSNPHDPSNPHTLPNGVRLRLALGTIINDLFARQAPTPPYRHQFQTGKSPTPSGHTPSGQTPSGQTPSGHTPGQSPASSFFNTPPTSLPPALTSLSTVCGAQATIVQPYPSGPSPANNFANYSPQPNRNHMQHPPYPTPSARTRNLYMVGADPDTASSPFRCPRHLHIGCEICVGAKTGGRPGAGAGRGRSTSFGGDYRNSQASSWKGMPGGVGPGGGGITGWQDGSGIGSGLLRPGVQGSCLRRKVTEQDIDDGASSTGSTGAGNTKLSELIPRFIKLSALVAAELGLEAREDTEDSASIRSHEAQVDRYSGNNGEWDNMQGQQQNRGEIFAPSPGPMSTNAARAVAQAQDRLYEYALRPTREWYMLLAGLLTRAVVEGYLTAGWRGPQAVECLLTVGLGMVEHADNEPPSGFEQFDPDGLPTLLDAMRLLFPASRTIGPLRKGQAEEEYEMEMYARLGRFYDIPASTDLSTHMEDLAWQYPAEPVERAAVRFCEAIARWRGKPELETYKKKPRHFNDNQGSPGSTSLSIDSLVHSNPTTPTMGHAPSSSTFPKRVKVKPSIDVYFTQPHYRDNNGWNPNKRTRSPDGGRSSAAKRPHG